MDGIISLVSGAACAKLADVMRDDIEYGQEAWDRLRERLAYLGPEDVRDRTGTDLQLSARAWRLVEALARTPYADLTALVDALESASAAAAV
jgi:hypothetical protein